MSGFMNRTTLEDFDEAYRYGVTLTLDELEKFDKLLDKIEKEFGTDSIILKHLLKIRERFL